MSEILEALDRWYGELARMNRSEETRRKYREVLEPFAERVKHKTLEEITPDDCRRYLDELLTVRPATGGRKKPRQPASASTMALYVSAMTGFFAFLEDDEQIPQSPMRKIKRPARPKPEDLPVTTISRTDVERMYAACKDDQEILCLTVLCLLGPRRTAAANLRWRDLDFERGTAKFQEKGGKTIVKPIPFELIDILYEVAVSGHVAAGPDDYVIPNRRPDMVRGPKRSAKVVYDTVKKIAERVGVEVHPHALRAAFAVQYIETHEGDLEALQELMGHARAETTKVYLRRQDKFKVMERVRDLSWGFALPPRPFGEQLGPEPAPPPKTDAEPVRRKLAELRDRNRAREQQ